MTAHRALAMIVQRVHVMMLQLAQFVIEIVVRVAMIGQLVLHVLIGSMKTVLFGHQNLLVRLNLT